MRATEIPSLIDMRLARIYELRIQDLRDALLKCCRKQNICLVLDHLPAKLHHRLQRLLEMLETCSALVCGLTAGPGTYDLYYWKFEAVEVVFSQEGRH